MQAIDQVYSQFKTENTIYESYFHKPSEKLSLIIKITSYPCTIENKHLYVKLSEYFNWNWHNNNSIFQFVICGCYLKEYN